MKCYCIFCKTQQAEEVARALAKSFSCEAFYPKRIQHTWSKGKMTDIEHVLLPGYVFLYREDDAEEIDVHRLHQYEGVLKILSYEDGEYELKGQDERFARLLYRKGGVLGKTTVYEEGQRIRIFEGPLEGVSSEILKVNRRNHRMLIEIPFADTKVKTWIEYEMVEKDEEA